MPNKNNENLRSPEFLNHLTHPENVGEMDNPDVFVEVSNPVCGDELKLYLSIRDGRIHDARFKAYGCAAALAASSLLTNLVKGKTLEQARKISSQAIADGLGGLPKHKIHAGDLAEDAINEALDQLKP